jgi:hypothetical protein
MQKSDARSATEEGIITDASFSQNPKASPPILTTESGIVIEVSFLQPLNAADPITVTEPGIVTSVRASEQQSKALSPIIFVPAGCDICRQQAENKLNEVPASSYYTDCAALCSILGFPLRWKTHKEKHPPL